MTISFEMYLKQKLYVWGRDGDENDTAVGPDEIKAYTDHADVFINYHAVAETAIEAEQKKNIPVLRSLAKP